MKKPLASQLTISSLDFSKTFFFATGFINLLLGSVFVLDISFNSGVVIIWVAINFWIVLICLYEIFFLATKLLDLMFGIEHLDQQLQKALNSNNEIILKNFQEIQRLQKEKEQSGAPIMQPVINVDPETMQGADFKNWAESIKNIDNRDKIR